MDAAYFVVPEAPLSKAYGSSTLKACLCLSGCLTEVEPLTRCSRFCGDCAPASSPWSARLLIFCSVILFRSRAKLCLGVGSVSWLQGWILALRDA